MLRFWGYQTRKEVEISLNHVSAAAGQIKLLLTSLPKLKGKSLKPYIKTTWVCLHTAVINSAIILKMMKR